MSLRERLLGFLNEDVGSGDITSSAVIPPALAAKAVVIAKENGVAAGLAEARELLAALGLRATFKVRDGDKIRTSQVLVEIKGNARRILFAERTLLNVLMRMSGIATQARNALDIARRIDKRVRIAATRKTAPGLMLLDKKAVALGGGIAHRMGLYDAVLIKDNHIALCKSAAEAVRRAKKTGRRIECEATGAAQALEAAAAGADAILLDNMSHGEMKKAIALLHSDYPKVKIELSGGINLRNLAKYARHGADVISIGSLTHSSHALDMSLEIVG
jgi:nicotinate-nucleotide pyrophosphorylase (carboxylating)